LGEFVIDIREDRIIPWLKDNRWETGHKMPLQTRKTDLDQLAKELEALVG
jgi:hypothetical protein